MEKLSRDLALLLAGTGWTDKKMRAVLRWVERNGAEPVIDLVMMLRVSVRTVSLESDDEYFESASAEHESAIEQVLHLLRNEAALAAAEAGTLLEDQLRRDQGLAHGLPKFNAKKGLKTWLKRVAKLVPPSELLHHATVVRNQAVHSPTTDWPLRKRK